MPRANNPYLGSNFSNKKNEQMVSNMDPTDICAKFHDPTINEKWPTNHGNYS